MNSLPHSPKNVNGKIIYIAAPADLFFAPAHQAAVEAVRQRFPKLHVFDAAREFASNDDWLRRWPDLLPQIAALVAVPRKDGSVGGDCGIAILDVCSMQLYGVPAAFAPPGPTRVDAASRLFVFEDGCLRRLRRFSLALSGTVSRMAFVSSRQTAHPNLRQAEAVQQ